MRAEFVSCGRCKRPYLSEESACTFCAAPPLRGAAKVFMGVMTPLVLAACYGSPGWELDDTGDTSTVDLDGDGWNSDVDCDDADENVNPDAIEDCADTIDNDCDDKIDGEDEDCADTGSGG